MLLGTKTDFDIAQTLAKGAQTRLLPARIPVEHPCLTLRNLTPARSRQFRKSEDYALAPKMANRVSH